MRVVHADQTWPVQASSRQGAVHENDELESVGETAVTTPANE